MITDGLAKHSFSNSTSEVWETFVPDFILQNYVNDLAIIRGIKLLRSKKKICGMQD